MLQDQILASAGVRNTAELKRRAKRLKNLITQTTADGRILPSIIDGFQRLTQRSVKFIRWWRQNLWSQRPLPVLWAILKGLYWTS